MAEDKDISAADYARYIEAIDDVSGAPGCPCCGKNGWEFHQETNGRSYALVGMERANPQLIGADVAWVVVLVCRNCGYLSTFLRATLSRWLAENP